MKVRFFCSVESKEYIEQLAESEDGVQVTSTHVRVHDSSNDGVRFIADRVGKGWQVTGVDYGKYYVFPSMEIVK